MTATTERPAPAIPGRVFITGANGFIGRALSARLRDLGAEVGGVDLVADAASGVVAGNTTDPRPWSEALTGVDTLIHTAAIVSNAAPLEQAWEVNVRGTRRVLDAAAAAGVRRFIHLSSVAAYGNDFPDKVDETYPIHVNGTSYTDTKVNSEAVVLAAHAAGEIDVTIIRPTDVVGPGSRAWVVEPLKIIKAGQMILADHGRGIFSPAYIDNFVDGISLALTADSASGQIFILGDGYGITCADYFGRLAAMAGGKVRSLPTSAAIALFSTLGTVQRAIGQPSELNAATVRMLNRKGTYSIEKARHTLGYEPIIDLDEGMARTESWARAEGLL